MEVIEYQNFVNQIKSGNISPYQMYNTDIDYPQYFAVQHYLQNRKDTIDINMQLNIGFLDIEVYCANAGEFPKPQEAKYPISSIVLRCTSEKKYVGFFRLIGKNANKFPTENIQEAIDYCTNELKTNGYMDEDESIEIHIYGNEIQLLNEFWNYIHRVDPSVLSGWNSSQFDTPYIYHRLCNILQDEKGQKTAQMMSKFGVVKKMKMGHEVKINISDYTDMDLMYLYKPRDEGGLNYGKKQASYGLDWVANAVLKLKKLEYNSTGMSLDTLYERDPLNYLLYNIIDVVLIKKLNEKLKHIESHNMLRRLMKTTIGLAMRGPAMLFDTMTQYRLTEQNKYTRFGLVQESANSVSAPKVTQIFKPKDNKVKWSIEDVPDNWYRKIMSRYPGAYVKEGGNRVVTLADGITIDMDATALYPSMMLQNNISFDSIFGRIIDPICYDFLHLVDQYIGTGKSFPPGIYNKFLEYAKLYTERVKPQNKGNYIQYTYLILASLFDKLVEKNITLKTLMEPATREHYIILKLYLLPLIDLLTEVHMKAEEYNTFSHDYILNGTTNLQHVFVIENIAEPTIKISQVKLDSFNDYLKMNNVSMNIAGTLLYTHEFKTGLYNAFLTEILALRKTYKDKRDTYPEGSEEYQFYDMRQLATKIVANTTYGLMGQSTFRYSNKWVAKTITVNGRLTLKISQICGELFLKNR